MRDGEQSPGASMSLEEKIQIARVFDELGIDIIEAGFPIASPGDFEAVTEVSKILKNSIPAGLSRHSVKDIDRATSPLAKDVRILEVTPPGAAAIIIKPTAISAGGSNIKTNTNANIGNNKTWQISPIQKSLG